MDIWPDIDGTYVIATYSDDRIRRLGPFPYTDVSHSRCSNSVRHAHEECEQILTACASCCVGLLFCRSTGITTWVPRQQLCLSMVIVCTLVATTIKCGMIATACRNCQTKIQSLPVSTKIVCRTQAPSPRTCNHGASPRQGAGVAGRTQQHDA